MILQKAGHEPPEGFSVKMCSQLKHVHVEALTAVKRADEETGCT